MEKRKAYLHFGVTALLMILMTVPALAQEKQERKLNILGPVKDYVTRVVIEEVKVTLLRPDSTVIDSCYNENGYMELRKLWYFPGLAIGKYIIKAEKEGYETLYSDIEIEKIHKRERFRLMSELLMQREKKVHMIDDVVVTATKVKFYHKGDTIVYNADAFQLAEGSMLDALVAQLPGAELKSDGRIYVNGRFIESLMLNGRDFFKGNNQVLLSNLPTYAVNTVKVYEKTGDLTRLMGKDMNDKSYVMDVNLKKQYNIGWLANVEGGLANHDLYMARLFAMRNTDHSNVALVGNINNLNDHSTPQRGSDWTPDKMPYGRLTTKSGGVTVNIDDRDGNFKFNGNANVTKYDNHQISNTYRTNFLSSGDTYDRMMKDDEIGNFFVNTSEKLNLTPGNMRKGVVLDFSHSFNYARRKNDTYSISATSTESWDGFKDFVNELSQPMLTDGLRQKLINRYMDNSSYERKELGTSLGAEASIRMRHSSDLLRILVNGNIYNHTSEHFLRKQTDFYGQNPSTDFRNQYTHGDPMNKGYNLNAGIYYTLGLNDKASFWLRYDYKRGQSETNNSLYRLDKLDGWGIDTENPFGTLPSEAEYMAAIDRNNSYKSKSSFDSHRESALLMWHPIESDFHFLEIRPQLSLVTNIDRLQYQRAQIDADKSRTKIFLDPEFEIIWWTKDGAKQRFNIYYTMTTSAPGLMNSLDIVDDSDPLNIFTYGNKNLKNIHHHRLDVTYTNRKGKLMYAPAFYFNKTDNSVAMGYVYDKQTGRKTYSPMNVNGNWNTRTQFNVSGPIDKQKRLYFNSNSQWQYINSVDMIGSETGAAPQESTVKTSILSENLSLNYQIGKHRIGLSGSFAWINSDSDREDFMAIDAYNYNYGVSGMLNLPWKFQLESDFSVYSRKGYEDASMNDDNFVWNARLIRPVLKGRLVLKLDAFDIFHQLKKVDRSINSQGRTERYYNSMPQYVLFHAIYKINVFPKNKKQ